MTRREVLAWLETRRPTPPEPLRAAFERAVTDAPLPLPDHLALLGGRLLAEVAAQPAGGRELALDLLAADALMTYAFEAQAELDATRLAALAERMGGAELDA